MPSLPPTLRLPELSYGVVCVILLLAVLVEHRLVTDRRTDTRRKHISLPRMHSIVRYFDFGLSRV